MEGFEAGGKDVKGERRQDNIRRAKVEEMDHYGSGMDRVIRELNTYGEVRPSYAEDFDLSEDDIEVKDIPN